MVHPSTGIRKSVEVERSIGKPAATADVAQPINSRGKPAKLAIPSLWTKSYVLLLLLQFCYGLSFSTFFVLPKYLITQWDASPILVGNAHGIFALGTVLTVPFVGVALDRIGRTPVLRLGLLLSILTFAPMVLVSSPHELFALRFIHGIAFGMVFSAGSTLVVDLAPPSRRAEAIGYFGTAMLCTNAFGPAAAEYLVENMGWDAVFFACSLYASAATLFSLALPKSSPARTVMTRPASALNTPSEPSRLQPTKALVGVLLAVVAVGVGVGTCKSFVPAIMVEEGAANISGYFIAFTCGALFQRIALARLPDRLGHLRATSIALVGYSIVLATLFALPVSAIPLFAALLGMVHGMAYPATVALSMGLVSAAQRGRVSAWSTGAFNLGFAISASGLAPFAIWVGYRGLLLLAALMVLAIAACVPLLLRQQNNGAARVATT